MEINNENITLTKSEKEQIKLSSAKCPFLRVAPLIPFADKYYFYCNIQYGKNVKLGINKAYIGSYCCNESTQMAYSSCEIWQESPSDNTDN